MWQLVIFHLLIGVYFQGCIAEQNTSYFTTTTPYMVMGDSVTLSPLESYTEVFCNGTHPGYCYTKISSDKFNRTVARATSKSYAAFNCPLFLNSTYTSGIGKWYLFNTSKIIGSFDFATKFPETIWSRNGTYLILEDGGLFINEARRDVVDKYICTYEASGSHANSTVISSLVLFRLDLSSWYSPVVFDSVFYGAIAVSFLLCGITFIINLIWIAIQKGGLYWIKRRERESRVQSMMQAVEVYRQRQIQNLQEAYHRNVTTIRDQYHMQVEQIRDAYTTQITRLKDYRQARIDNVASHLDSIRDNYNQQLSRIREYGSRHGEQLWESYERQLNRVRTFNLQQRLKLMRQYKLKQRHVNKLLANVDEANIGEETNEENIRRVFDLANEILPAGSIPLRRSISCLSLPEFTLVDGTDAPELQELPPRRLTNQMDFRQFRRQPRKSVSESETDPVGPPAPSSIEEAVPPPTHSLIEPSDSPKPCSSKSKEHSKYDSSNYGESKQSVEMRPLLDSKPN